MDRTPDRISEGSDPGRMPVRARAEEARRAVMHVIETESAAYLARDYEGWARCWVHSPHLQRWYPAAGAMPRRRAGSCMTGA